MPYIIHHPTHKGVGDHHYFFYLHIWCILNYWGTDIALSHTPTGGGGYISTPGHVNPYSLGVVGKDWEGWIIYAIATVRRWIRVCLRIHGPFRPQLLVQVLPVGPNQLGHAGLRRIVDTNLGETTQLGIKYHGCSMVHWLKRVKPPYGYNPRCGWTEVFSDSRLLGSRWSQHAEVRKFSFRKWSHVLLFKVPTENSAQSQH